ncbi:hypothetical protein DBV39_16895 [Orrella marina]|uniref:Uncharacterized protein n=1 Tax=Orrella marina TaxID=2163011 RepID=A0A2R4XMX3_9BURK|nr:hypothetical protein DBV39_16895 [Orrella marina]
MTKAPDNKNQQPKQAERRITAVKVELCASTQLLQPSVRSCTDLRWLMLPWLGKRPLTVDKEFD